MNGRIRLVLIVVPVVLFGLLGPDRAEARRGYPRVLNYHLTNNVDEAKIELLARWDVLVLDKDFPYENPAGLAALRALNPEIVLLAYIPINGTDPEGWRRPPETVQHQYWAGCEEGDFWLYGVDGSPVSDWPGKWSTNVTANGPVNSLGERFPEWFARFVAETVYAGGAPGWDGVFLDDVWDRVSWLNSFIGSPIDSDRDGTADDSAVLDADWREGNRIVLERLRAAVGPDVAIVTNGVNTHYSSSNGTMIEDFPTNGPVDAGNPYGYAWQHWMRNAPGAYFTNVASFLDVPGQICSINARWAGTREAPDRRGRFEAHKRFCLGSTLLGDGYFSFDFQGDHASTWWEPEYDLYLGDPLGPAFSFEHDGAELWRRDYREAVVVVNPNPVAVSARGSTPAVEAWDAYIGPAPVGTRAPVPEGQGGFALPPAEVDVAPLIEGPGLPGSSSMRLSLRLPERARVIADVHDVRGRRLARLTEGDRSAGVHELQWDGRVRGAPAGNGVYFLRVRAGAWQGVRRLVMLTPD